MKFAVIGNPIDKSLSPQLHEILYEKLNILNCSFEKIHIENDKLDDFFNYDFGLFNGINVTIPFKSKVVKFLDVIDDEAKILGNINCISKLNNKIFGFNTDKYGFDMLLTKNDINIKGSPFIYEDFVTGQIVFESGKNITGDFRMDLHAHKIQTKNNDGKIFEISIDSTFELIISCLLYTSPSPRDRG